MKKNGTKAKTITFNYLKDLKLYQISGPSLKEECEYFLYNVIMNDNKEITMFTLNFDLAGKPRLIIHQNVNDSTNPIMFTYKIDHASFGNSSADTKLLISFLRKLGFNENLISDEEIMNPRSLTTGLSVKKIN